MKDYSNKKNKSSYNTQSKVAERIANKLEEGRNKINSMKNKDQKSVFCNAISSLADGLKLPLKTVYNEFTVYQFYNQLKRYQKHEEYEQLMRALLAGAKDIKLDTKIDKPNKPAVIQLMLSNGRSIAEYIVDDLDELLGGNNKLYERSVGVR